MRYGSVWRARTELVGELIRKCGSRDIALGVLQEALEETNAISRDAGHSGEAYALLNPVFFQYKLVFNKYISLLGQHGRKR